VKTVHQFNRKAAKYMNTTRSTFALAASTVLASLAFGSPAAPSRTLTESSRLCKRKCAAPLDWPEVQRELPKEKIS